MAAFFLAWAHGPAGAMATDGANTGSLTAAAEATAVAADMRPTTAASQAAERRAEVEARSVQAAMRDPAQAKQL